MRFTGSRSTPAPKPRKAARKNPARLAWFADKHLRPRNSLHLRQKVLELPGDRDYLCQRVRVCFQKRPCLLGEANVHPFAFQDMVF